MIYVVCASSGEYTEDKTEWRVRGFSSEDDAIGFAARLQVEYDKAVGFPDDYEAKKASLRVMDPAAHTYDEGVYWIERVPTEEDAPVRAQYSTWRERFKAAVAAIRAGQEEP